MEMFYKEVLWSFFSRPYYNAAARQKKGIGAKFILALTVITILIFAISFRGEYAELGNIAKKMPAIADSLPVVTFKDGKLSIDKPVPYEIKLLDTATDAPRIVIDTSYKITDLTTLQEKMKKEKILVLITEDTSAVLGSGDELKIRDFKDVKPLTIRHEDWKKMGEALEKWGLTVIVGFMIVFAAAGGFIFNLIATFFSAVVAHILGYMLSARLEFDASMRLAATARLPATVISLAPLLLGLPKIGGAAGWLLWGGYLVFAVMAAGKASAVQPETLG